jgi:hypothetical protein
MTQKEMVLDYLRKNGSITTLESMKKLLILDLQSNIRYLRNDGYDITDEYITKRNIYGQKSSFKRYYLKGAKI